MKNNYTNLSKIELRKKLYENYEKKKDAINCIIVGGGTFVILSPILLTNLNISKINTTADAIPLCFASLLELGLIVLPIKGIKDIVKSSKNIKLIKKQISNETISKNELNNSCETIKNHIGIKIEKEDNKKKLEKLKKLRKEIDKLYSPNIEESIQNEKNISYKK